jgi:hypothetical protein
MHKRLIVLLAAFVLSAAVVYAHGGNDHLTGTITAIEGDHIQIKDQAGKSVMVMVVKTTKYLKDEKASTKADLKVGTRILVDAKMDEKMKMYSAEEIHIGVADKAPAPKPAATSKVAPAGAKGK